MTLPKRRVADVSIDGGGSEELRMIEDVEGLQPELQQFAIVQRNLLLQRHVEVLQAGAVEEAARNIAQGAETDRTGSGAAVKRRAGDTEERGVERR